MFKIIKNSFKTTNESIILATPLIVFLSILSWYGNYAADVANTIFKQIFAGVTIFIMACGFLSAWLYMAKKTIALSKKVFVFDKDRANALIDLLTTLPKGIGRLFLPIIGVLSIYIFVYLGLSSVITFIADKYELTFVQWRNLFIPGAIFISFITLLWLPEIVYGDKNAFIALFKSIKKVFINFKNSIILYSYILFLVVGISFINSMLLFHPIIAFFVLIIFYYILVYIIVLLFSYYEQNFIEE
ncbi:hypothetical protein IJ541_03300 [bacterium]|nr:hypothetical protein [bacterium]